MEAEAAQNACDPSISGLNSGIAFLIQTHTSDILREHLDTHSDHNTHLSHISVIVTI